MLARLQELHPEEVSVTYRPFPLISIHDKASLAGEAAEAAGEQGAFWAMHDYLFEHYDEWVSLDEEAFLGWLLQAGEEIGLGETFAEAMQSRSFQEGMIAAYNRNLASGLTSTPFIFINGVWFRIEPTLENLEAATRLTLLREKQWEAPPPMTIQAGEKYLARIQTTEGDLLIELFSDAAPNTVNNFIFLAENGWYDDNPIFRVVPGSLAETGDPTGTGFGTPGYFIDDEINPDLDFSQAGMVAMSSAGPNTNGSQYFITLAPLPSLDGTRTIFGRVLSGLDGLQALEERDPFADMFAEQQPVVISIEIEKQ